jgi:hypothetical protein
LNAYAERFVRTIKEGCLDQMILFGRKFVAEQHSPIHGPLSPGAQSSGLGKPVDHSDESNGKTRRDESSGEQDWAGC